MHAMPREEERQRKSDGGIPIRVSQPGQATGFGPAWLRSDAPACFHFFFRRLIAIFWKSLQD
jgi:hypothetical protein